MVRAPPVDAGVTISGRVFTPSGQGLRNVFVSLIDTNSVRRAATTSSFGVYTFENVRTQESYILIAVSKRFRFAPQNIVLTASRFDLDLFGLE